MISDEQQLQQTLEQMGRMYRALCAIHAEVAPRNLQQFALMAEGPLEEIRRLEQQISEYLDKVLEPVREEALRAEEAERVVLDVGQG